MNKTLIIGLSGLKKDIYIDEIDNLNLIIEKISGISKSDQQLIIGTTKIYEETSCEEIKDLLDQNDNINLMLINNDLLEICNLYDLKKPNQIKDWDLYIKNLLEKISNESVCYSFNFFICPFCDKKCDEIYFIPQFSESYSKGFAYCGTKYCEDNLCHLKARLNHLGLLYSERACINEIKFDNFVMIRRSNGKITNAIVENFHLNDKNELLVMCRFNDLLKFKDKNICTRFILNSLTDSEIETFLPSYKNKSELLDMTSTLYTREFMYKTIYAKDIILLNNSKIINKEYLNLIHPELKDALIEFFENNNL